MTTTTATRPSAVIPGSAARGAAFLDEHVPGWADRIDLAALDLDSCTKCVLGQLFDGSYVHAVNALDLGFEAQCAHGFDLWSGAPLDEDYGNTAVTPEDWNDLRNQWIDEVRQRRGRDGGVR